jgi:hypothetical protein
MAKAPMKRKAPYTADDLQNTHQSFLHLARGIATNLGSKNSPWNTNSCV